MHEMCGLCYGFFPLLLISHSRPGGRQLLVFSPLVYGASLWCWLVGALWTVVAVSALVA